MRFNIDNIFCLILINISIVLTTNLKDEPELNVRICKLNSYFYLLTSPSSVTSFDKSLILHGFFFSLAPQHYHSLNILISHKKRETNPYPLNFVPSRTNPFRKRSQNEHEKNSKNSRRKRIISKRNPGFIL